MESRNIAKQMIDFQKATFNNTFNTMVMLHEQTEKMLNTSFEQSTWLPEEGKRVVNEWVQAYRRGCEDFKKSLDENFKRLDFKNLQDQIADEMWRNFRLPRLQEVAQLQESLNLLESRLVALQERDWSREVINPILKKRSLAAREDLKPLKKALKDIERGMARVSEVHKVGEAVTQLEEKVSGLGIELAKIKELMAELDPKLDSPSSAFEKVVGKAGTRKSGSAK